VISGGTANLIAIADDKRGEEGGSVRQSDEGPASLGHSFAASLGHFFASRRLLDDFLEIFGFGRLLLLMVCAHVQGIANKSVTLLEANDYIG
jgi:hypothetical protein